MMGAVVYTRGRSPIAEPAEVSPTAVFPLAHSIYTRLKEQIVTFRIKPGESLQELRLAASFDVSRTPIREALRMLSREGLVEIRPRQGAYVAALSVADLLDAYEVRYHLEPAAARKAARTVTPAVLAELHTLAESCLDRPASFAEVLAAERADAAFHDLILAQAGNVLIRKMVQEVRLKIQRLAFYVRPARYHQAHDEHRAILRALRSADPDGAETRMREHIQSARLASLDTVSE
jgi:DNA-binding GntR family transcriptional regulator